jgi:hypothetical protein
MSCKVIYCLSGCIRFIIMKTVCKLGALHLSRYRNIQNCQPSFTVYVIKFRLYGSEPMCMSCSVNFQLYSSISGVGVLGNALIHFTWFIAIILDHIQCHIALYCTQSNHTDNFDYPWSNTAITVQFDGKLLLKQTKINWLYIGYLMQSNLPIYRSIQKCGPRSIVHVIKIRLFDWLKALCSVHFSWCLSFSLTQELRILL